MAKQDQYVVGGQPSSKTQRKANVTRLAITIILAIVCSCYVILFPPYKRGPTHALTPSPKYNISHSSHCVHVLPIPPSSYISRQSRLAHLLHELQASAYIAEPGANAQYFTGIGKAEWRLSERPLLLAVKAAQGESAVGDNNTVVHEPELEAEPEVVVLTPKFEASRARLLPVQARKLTFIEWPEEANPYKTLLSALDLDYSDQHDSESDPGTNSKSQNSKAIIYVDPMIRKFIADGLQEAAAPEFDLQVLSAPKEIRRLRERKDAEEIEILKCANEATLIALRAARDKMRIGMRESEARRLVEAELAAEGLKGAFALTLFGENAALPHGSGTDRTLTATDMVLVDCGGSLHGYNSDLTRTFSFRSMFPAKIPPKHLDAWSAVRAAQDAVLDAASQSGAVTGDVDEAARKALREFKGKDGGYGGGTETGLEGSRWDMWFTHRVGHGIGLEGHEPPYLVGESTDKILPGHTFSNEPGVYVEGQFGVRLEDVFVIDKDGKAVLLTEGVGGMAKTLWDI